jgi:hypothetical protein
VDFSKFKIHDWLMIGGGAAMFLLGLVLDWTSYSTGIGSTSGDNAFNYFFTGGIAWLLVVSVGALALLRVLGKLPPTRPWPLIFLGAGGVAVLLMVLRIILGTRFDFADRGIGMYGALVWSAIVTAGAFILFTSSGGNVNDLKNFDKLKESFSAGSDDEFSPPSPPSPAPPASPASAAPPPPPPPAAPAPQAFPAPSAPPPPPAPPAPPAP